MFILRRSDVRVPPAQPVHKFEQSNEPENKEVDMEILVSIVCSYLIMGLSAVITALSASPLHRPLWVMNPKLSSFLFAICCWPLSVFFDFYCKSNKTPRGIVIAIVHTTIQVLVPVILFWLSMKLVGLVISFLIIQILLSCIVFYLITIIISPIFPILGFIITLPVWFILDFIFPLDDPKKIEYCKTCKHFKENKTYEDSINGLWHNPIMPEISLLPCNNYENAQDVWKEYFNLNVENRTIFPKSCDFWEKK